MGWVVPERVGLHEKPNAIANGALRSSTLIGLSDNAVLQVCFMLLCQVLLRARGASAFDPSGLYARAFSDRSLSAQAHKPSVAIPTKTHWNTAQSG